MERGLAPSRSEAQRLIERGEVRIDGVPAGKAATLVAPDDRVTLVGTAPRWASRAGEKLDAALHTFGVDVGGARALDVGASTGGFTDVLLSRGVHYVVALDVGYGQLSWRLRTDPRVEVRERVNFRTVDPSSIGAPFDVITIDVSFIGVSMLAAQIAACSRPGTDVIVLVKPQFEIGRDRVGRGGIVRDAAAHRDAVAGVAEALGKAGFGVQAAMPSPIAGAKGNREFLLHAVLGEAGREALDLAEEVIP